MMHKKIIISLLTIIICCLSCTALISLLLLGQYANNQYCTLSELTNHILLRYPESEQEIMALIKDSILHHDSNPIVSQTILSDYGYTPKTIAEGYINDTLLFVVIAVPLILLLLFLLISFFRKMYQKRILHLTNYLELVNSDNSAAILTKKEDDFSKLEDEIYKTVTKLQQTKEAALTGRQNLADNLAHISHQIKTPVTSISLMTQLIENGQNHSYIERIKNLTTHLEHLVDALLTLSRIDAGTLMLDKNPVDVYTLLQLSIETLQEKILQKNLRITLPDRGEFCYLGDMEWSMEAVSNIIKNCIRHTQEEGMILLDYNQNPLYTEILITDNGSGISSKDLPHIFERFYRGENAQEGGTGIGLSLAKSLIELQNGVIHAKNLPDGGACFLIRFYSH